MKKSQNGVEVTVANVSAIDWFSQVLFNPEQMTYLSHF